MPNVTFTRLQGDSGGAAGTERTIDSALINPDTEIAAMTNDQLRLAGVARGTRISPGGGVDPFDVQESVTDARSIVRAANALAAVPTLILRDGMGAASEDFTAAAFAAITGLSITVPAGFSGTVLVTIGGTGESTNAAASGGAVRVTKNGAPIGRTLTWPAAQFAVNGVSSMGLGAMGPQISEPTVPGDVWGVEAACVPGGGADIFRVRDVTLTLEKMA